MLYVSLSYMKEFMAADGNKPTLEKYIKPFTNEILFSRITDRRVMGSMNDFVFQAKVYLIEYRQARFSSSEWITDVVFKI